MAQRGVLALLASESRELSHATPVRTPHLFGLGQCGRDGIPTLKRMTAGWLVLSLAVAAASLILGTTWFRRGGNIDLGSVSHQWIAEQRAGQGYDPQR